MAGVFDKTITPAGWFDETAQAGGWFDAELLTTNQADGPSVVDVTDTASLSLAEALESFLASDLTDTAGLSLSEAVDLYGENTLVATDTASLTLGEAVSVEAFTYVEPEPESGGFWLPFDAELARRRRDKKKREEEEEEAKRIADEVAREIALLMRAQDDREAEEADLERLKRLVSKADQARANEALSKSTLKAFNAAKANMDRYALLAFERQIQKEAEEEEEYIVLQLLLDD